jgi:hypothetical protein
MAKDMKQDRNTGLVSPFGDLTRMLEQFKVPGMDMSSFVEARRKDVEAVVEANRNAYEAMQALARTQTEMLTQAMQGMQEAAKGAAGGVAPDPVKQAELAGKAWHKMLADAVAGMTQRAAEHMKEVQHMAQPK